MDLLTKCESLLNELTFLVQDMEAAQSKLQDISESDYEVIEEILERNFISAMRASGCYEDLLDSLDQLKEEEGMRFHANRIEKEINRLDVVHD